MRARVAPSVLKITARYLRRSWPAATAPASTAAPISKVTPAVAPIAVISLPSSAFAASTISPTLMAVTSG